MKEAATLELLPEQLSPTRRKPWVGMEFLTGSLERRIGAILVMLVVLAAAQVVGVLILVRQQASDARAVDVAGRQAVLSQKIAKDALRLIRGDESTRASLQAEANEFEVALRGLTDGSDELGLPPSSDAVIVPLQALFDEWRPMAEAVRSNPREYDRAWDYIVAHNDNLLARSNNVVAALVDESEQKTQRLILFLFMMVLVAAAIFGVALLVVRRTVTQPVRGLALVAQRVQAGDLHARAPILGQDELGGVAASLNTMLDEITALVQTREERDGLQRQITKLLDEVSEVAQGDLTVQAEVTSGTLGAVADAFNYMIEELRGIIENVNRTASEVADSTTRILNASSQLAVQAEAQAMRILQATEAVDEMSEVAQTVADNAATGAEIAGQARRNAADGSQAVRETVDGMHRIRTQVQETSKKIKRLGESSQEIGQIVQLIQDIADQTNLLALNAAIQAAMAGEHGRGFAVVADEVRRLAERASVATKQIAGLVTSIQADTNEAVMAMENGTREVVDGSQLANTAGQHLEAINLVVDQLSGLIEEISGAAAREATASAAIRAAMAEISQTTSTSAAGSRQAAESVGYLARLSEQLQTSVAAFRLGEQKSPAQAMGAA
jgi:methyl-accepting chemotaxis protein